MSDIYENMCHRSIMNLATQERIRTKDRAADKLVKHIQHEIEVHETNGRCIKSLQQLLDIAKIIRNRYNGIDDIA